KPVLARVQGGAYGGGVGLCCACDIVFAAPQARFAVSEAKFGILPSVIGPYLNNTVGKRNALRLALTAEQIDAHRALQMGLVQEVVEADQLDARIEQTVTQLLANGPHALGANKRSLDKQIVGVIGAGTMGAGIAQVAAAAGHPVRLMDVRPGVAAGAHQKIGAALDGLVSKGRMTAQEKDALMARIVPVEKIGD